MRKSLPFLLVALLAGCGGGGSTSSLPGTAQDGAVAPQGAHRATQSITPYTTVDNTPASVSFSKKRFTVGLYHQRAFSFIVTVKNKEGATITGTLTSPVSLTVAGDNNTTISLSPAILSAGQTTVNAVYNGGVLAGQSETSGSLTAPYATITASIGGASPSASPPTITVNDLAVYFSANGTNFTRVGEANTGEVLHVVAGTGGHLTAYEANSNGLKINFYDSSPAVASILTTQITVPTTGTLPYALGYNVLGQGNTTIRVEDGSYTYVVGMAAASNATGGSLPLVFVSYTLPTASGISPTSAILYQFTAGNDGDIYFADNGNGALGQLTPGGKVHEYKVPLETETGYPLFGKIVGVSPYSDGRIYFTDTECGIGSSDPLGNMAALTLLPGCSKNFEFVPTYMAKGPDNNLWFINSETNAIGQFTPGGAYVNYLLTTTPGAFASGTRVFDSYITAGPDNAMWFAEAFGNKIGRISTDGLGTITEYPLPNANSHPVAIVAGPDGALWFTENVGNRIGRIDVGGNITEYPLPQNVSSPLAMSVGGDNNVWFTTTTGIIGKVVPATGQITTYLTPGISTFTRTTAGPYIRIQTLSSGLTTGTSGSLYTGGTTTGGSTSAIQIPPQ